VEVYLAEWNHFVGWPSDFDPPENKGGEDQSVSYVQRRCRFLQAFGDRGLQGERCRSLSSTTQTQFRSREVNIFDLFTKNLHEPTEVLTLQKLLTATPKDASSF